MKPRISRQIVWGVAASLAFGGLALSGLAQTRPADGRGAGRGEGPSMRDSRRGGGPDSADRPDRSDRSERSERSERRFMGRQGYVAPPSELEWDQCSQFMQEHSPRRWQAFQKLMDSGRVGEPMIDRLRSVAYGRYQGLQRLQGDDPALYDIRLKRVQVDDTIFGIIIDLRDGPDDQRSDLRQKLREQVGKLVDLGLDEREHRIKQLERMVAEERDRLTRDQQHRDQLVEKRIDSAIEEGRRVNPLGPGDGDGMHQGPGGGPGPGGGMGPGGGGLGPGGGERHRDRRSGSSTYAAPEAASSQATE